MLQLAIIDVVQTMGIEACSEARSVYPSDHSGDPWSYNPFNQLSLCLREGQQHFTTFNTSGHALHKSAINYCNVGAYISHVTHTIFKSSTSHIA